MMEMRVCSRIPWSRTEGRLLGYRLDHFQRETSDESGVGWVLVRAMYAMYGTEDQVRIDGVDLRRTSLQLSKDKNKRISDKFRSTSRMKTERRMAGKHTVIRQYLRRRYQRYNDGCSTSE